MSIAIISVQAFNKSVTSFLHKTVVSHRGLWRAIEWQDVVDQVQDILNSVSDLSAARSYALNDGNVITMVVQSAPPCDVDSSKCRVSCSEDEDYLPRVGALWAGC